MKKIILLPVSLLMLLTLVFVACEKESEDVCERFETPTCSIDVTYCADDEYGYYLYNDSAYTCADDECIDAIDEILIKANCKEAICERFETPICAIDVTYCADDEYGYLLYNDQKYVCLNDDCDEAIEEILEDANCSSLTSSAELKTSTIDDKLFIKEMALHVKQKAIDVNSFRINKDKTKMKDVAKRVMAEARAAAGCN